MDKEQYLFISGRIKEQFKLQNGKFVSPSPMEDIYNRSVYISQSVVCGADREYNVALIAPDLVELQRWAGENNISFPSPTSDRSAFFLEPAVIALISKEIQHFEGELNSYERIRAWTFVDPFTPENDLLTQKMSLKRHNIAQVYEKMIDGLYAKQLGNFL
jgi:long-chain acyl-CoA synthetase